MDQQLNCFSQMRGQAPSYDAHVHMALDGIDWKASLARHKAVPDDELIRQVLQTYVACGCTYVRDGGDKYGAGLRAAQLAGEYQLTYASCAFPIFQKGNYGAFIGRAFEDFSEYCALVDEAQAAGATFIKIMTTGILDFNSFGVLTGNALSADLLCRMVAYAHEQGFSVMAHTNGAQAVQEAVRAGVDSVEHAYYLDDAAREALAESQTIWVPTFAPICNLIGTGRFPDEILKKIAADQELSVKKVASLGGIIACGSDAGASCVLHGQAAADERAFLQRALGESCDDVLAAGLGALRKRFPGRRELL